MPIQLYYPILGEGQNEGFFTYSDPNTSKYVSLKPTVTLVTNTDKLYIRHDINTSTYVWIIFKLVNDAKAKNLYYEETKQIKLNDLIMSQDSTFFTNNITYTWYGLGSSPYDFSTGTHVFEMPNAIKVSNSNPMGKDAEKSFSEKQSSEEIELTKSTFASMTDDLICDESEVDTPPPKPISNSISLYIGAVMLSAFVLMGCLMLVKMKNERLIIFAANTGLLGGFGTQKIYLIITGLFFLLSLILFILSSVKIKDISKKKDVKIHTNYSMMFAFIFLVNTIIMMWFKVAVFTEAHPVVAAAPGAVAAAPGAVAARAP